MIQTRYPVAYVSGSWLASSGTTADIPGLIDDVGEPDPAGYAYSTYAGFPTSKLLLTTDPFAVTASSIASVSVIVEWAVIHFAGTNFQGAAYLVVGGTQYAGEPAGTYIVHDGSYESFTTVWATNPVTHAAWTEAQVKNLAQSANLTGIAIEKGYHLTETFTLRVAAVRVELDFEGTDNDPVVVARPVVIPNHYRLRSR